MEGLGNDDSCAYEDDMDLDEKGRSIKINRTIELTQEQQAELLGARNFKNYGFKDGAWIGPRAMSALYPPEPVFPPIKTILANS